MLSALLKASLLCQRYAVFRQRSLGLTVANLGVQETAKLEHEAFALRQKVALSAEIKSTLDSWVRYEAQARDAEQKELVNSVMQKVLKDLEDPKIQKDILAQAVADIECEWHSLHHCRAL